MAHTCGSWQGASTPFPALEQPCMPAADVFSQLLASQLFVQDGGGQVLRSRPLHRVPQPHSGTDEDLGDGHCVGQKPKYRLCMLQDCRQGPGILRLQLDRKAGLVASAPRKPDLQPGLPERAKPKAKTRLLAGVLLCSFRFAVSLASTASIPDRANIAVAPTHVLIPCSGQCP